VAARVAGYVGEAVGAAVGAVVEVSAPIVGAAVGAVVEATTVGAALGAAEKVTTVGAALGTAVKPGARKKHKIENALKGIILQAIATRIDFMGTEFIQTRSNNYPATQRNMPWMTTGAHRDHRCIASS